jgi:hypothetical protein
MIWFACRNCNKKHSRPESSSGTMIFCDCGQGLTVPWESTVEPPPVAEVPEPLPPVPRPPPLPARLDPIPIGEERVPPRPRPPDPPAPEPPLARPVRGRRAAPRRRDPRFCFNHEDGASVKACADCGEAFCAECLLEFRGDTLCGPCKNFRVRTLQRPPRLSGKAIASALTALIAWPLGCGLWLVFVNANASWAALFCLVPQLAALALGLLALRDTETNPRVGGRSLAVTGVVTGAVACVLLLILTIFPPALPS